MAVLPIVLIAADRSWAQATAELLRTEGFEVDIAEDGERGLELVETSRPLMVILDAHVPKVGGLEILREIRQSDAELPVLITSADDRSALINQAMGAGASGFLRKPVAAGLLLKAVRRLTGKAPTDSSPSQHAS